MNGSTLFRGGRGYRAVRIPALAAVGEVLVVIAVGRRRISDWGPSDLLIRRSVDRGRTWTPARVLVRGWGQTTDNPTLLHDPATGLLHLFFQTGYRRLWHAMSRDAGAGFSRPVRLELELPLGGVAPGPGAGAVLGSGRLVIPIWMLAARRHRPSATGTLVSDDHGMTWRAGEIVAGPGGAYPHPSEAAVAATADGGAVLTFRQRAVDRRMFSWSADGASGWTAPRAAEELFEPVSHAALTRVGDRLAFVNPDSRESATPVLSDGKRPRENLTLRWSDDDGHSWGAPEVIDPGPSGYAVLASGAGGLHVVWEHGRLRRTALWPTSIMYARMG